MFDYQIELEVGRANMAATIGENTADSTVTVRSHGTDLIAAWDELLAQLPTHLVESLTVAVRKTGNAHDHY